MFQPQNRLAKWSQVKNGFKNLFFVKKLKSKLCTFGTIQFDSNFPSIWIKYLSNNVRRNLRLLVSAFATVARKNFNGKYTAKIDFSHRAFYVTVTDADIGSRKPATHIHEYLDRMLVKFEQNCMIQNIQNLELFCQKMINHFSESVDAIWKTFL